ncbi:MAG: HD domain-containing protein [Myxococcaceae bacterium]
MTAQLGSLAWLEQTHGVVSRGERVRLFTSIFGSVWEGAYLSLRAMARKRNRLPLSGFEPPSTAMVNAAREHLLKVARPAMANHSHRTAFWTQLVLAQHGELGERDRETAWVAALLHDVGLDAPPERGDFSQGGVEVLKRLAHQHRWPEEQVHQAGEAIAINLSMGMDVSKAGPIAWAMNVGGAGDFGYAPHRGQWHRDRRRELDARFPRDGFRKTALEAIGQEIARVPNGRFAFFRPLFQLLLWD